MAKTALIAGATGLVGGYCIAHLLSSPEYSRVIALTRRPLQAHPKLETRVVDFRALVPADCQGANDVFCALGTTMAKAGSREAFRAVDYGYVKALAEVTHAAEARQFVLVSSTGANSKSINFYARVKGEAEAAVASLPFDTVHIFCPSLLLGPRSESRPAETIGRVVASVFNTLMVGSLRKYRAIEAEKVARAMVAAALTTHAPGVHTYSYDRILQLAAGRV